MASDDREALVAELETLARADVREPLIQYMDAYRRAAQALRAVPTGADRDVLRRALVECALPYEALLADTESRKWIAPSVWEAMERAVVIARAALLRPAATEGEKNA